MQTQPNVALRLDNEDMDLLKQACKAEKLTRSDIIRRALRAYVKQLCATPQQEKAI
jgi:uncharacterized protein (DUF1778 family)